MRFTDRAVRSDGGPRGRAGPGLMVSKPEMTTGRANRSARAVSVLIADDHEVARHGIRAILESERDLRVVAEAGNGREVMEKIKSCVPDVVLMDIGMPEMNGMETTRRLRQEFPNIEVLILTMHFSEELLNEAVQAGAKGYVLKNDADEELIGAVHSVSRHRSYYSSKFSTTTDGGPANSPFKNPQNLSGREYEVLQMLAEGRSNKEVARALKISVKTVETHRANVMRKLNAHTLSELVRYAIRNRIAQP